ncbi:MAG: PH domain-containing protein [Deltaproteobacteria bacterium]|nr:PH domain-containing protein [Deltaproteobacteria bacterium]
MPEAKQPLRKEFPLRLRKILKKSFSSFIKVFIFGGILTVIIVTALDPDDGWADQRMIDHRLRLVGIWLFVLFCFMFGRMIYEYIYYRTYYYDMDDLNVLIRKGVVSKREVTLPFTRITDVYVDQDIPDVVLALYDVHISTPTQESGEFAHIDGLNKADAMELKRRILERINDKTA